MGFYVRMSSMACSMSKVNDSFLMLSLIASMIIALEDGLISQVWCQFYVH